MEQNLKSGEILIYQTEDGFLKFNEKEILTHAGKITHQQAIDRANSEYDKYKMLGINEKSLVDKHFDEAILAIKKFAGLQD